MYTFTSLFTIVEMINGNYIYLLSKPPNTRAKPDEIQLQKSMCLKFLKYKGFTILSCYIYYRNICFFFCLSGFILYTANIPNFI